jgi:integrase
MNHRHEWIEDNNYLKCSTCGKKKLKLIPTSKSDIYFGTKSDGSKYLVRANRDAIFTPDEWLSFFSKLTDNQTFTFKFLLLTGARIMEAQHVKPEDIDFANQRIVLKVTKQRHGDNVINKSKTRTIRVSRDLIKDIRKIIQDKNLKKDEFLGLLSQPAAHSAMKKAMQKANIKNWQMLSVHSIRKTSENWALSLGIDSMILSTRFGHNIVTQYEHYSQSDAFTPKEKEQIRQLYGDTFI